MPDIKRANKKPLNTLTADELIDLSLKHLASLRHHIEVAGNTIADASPSQRAKFVALMDDMLKRLQEHADVINPRPIPPSPDTKH